MLVLLSKTQEKGHERLKLRHQILIFAVARKLRRKRGEESRSVSWTFTRVSLSVLLGRLVGVEGAVAFE